MNCFILLKIDNCNKILTRTNYSNKPMCFKFNSVVEYKVCTVTLTRSLSLKGGCTPTTFRPKYEFRTKLRPCTNFEFDPSTPSPYEISFFASGPNLVELERREERVFFLNSWMPKFITGLYDRFVYVTSCWYVNENHLIRTNGDRQTTRWYWRF